jgi:hypothetical protein
MADIDRRLTEIQAAAPGTGLAAATPTRPAPQRPGDTSSGP